jgi:Mg2+ and Co2+ transporter CorA
MADFEVNLPPEEEETKARTPVFAFRDADPVEVGEQAPEPEGTMHERPQEGEAEAETPSPRAMALDSIIHTMRMAHDNAMKADERLFSLARLAVDLRSGEGSIPSGEAVLQLVDAVRHTHVIILASMGFVRDVLASEIRGELSDYDPATFVPRVLQMQEEISQLCEDLDIHIERDPENGERLMEALANLRKVAEAIRNIGEADG